MKKIGLCLLWNCVKIWTLFYFFSFVFAWQNRATRNKFLGSFFIPMTKLEKCSRPKIWFDTIKAKTNKDDSQILSIIASKALLVFLRLPSIQFSLRKPYLRGRKTKCQYCSLFYRLLLFYEPFSRHWGGRFLEGIGYFWPTG